LVGDRRGGHQLDGLVLQDLVLAARQTYVAELLAEVCDLLGVGGVEADQLAAAALHGRRHAHDVIVVEADHREPDLVLGLGAGIRARRGDLLDRRPGHRIGQGRGRHGRGHACRHQERASTRQIFHRVSPGAVILMSLIEAPGVA
jgi:hypothetical protein